MVISASRRTDIPCLYSEWFLNRLKAGYVITRNPMNYRQLSKISLSKDYVDCIVFWTKDPLNLIAYLGSIDNMGYKYGFQFTLNPYDKTIEKNLRDKEDIINTFKRLSNRIGKEKIIWRYDPIILTEHMNIDYHKEKFKYLCDRLHNYTDKVIISFVDIYAKIKRIGINEMSVENINIMASIFGEIAREYDMLISTCCEKDLLIYGIKNEGCLSMPFLESICNYSLKLNMDRNQRKECKCVQSIDVGAYNTCTNGCIYCYATKNQTMAINHDPVSDMLSGNICENDKLTERSVFLNKSEV